ncbi:unnamed protein product [Clonostachys solani]|uniref:Uncharacterized protein n=1 Tax=Clonostachys solani TaxID=160281 RepID=A0A9N9Z0L1_9HYPO|nr:unnamed protein product [Clonostachys solani]
MDATQKSCLVTGCSAGGVGAALAEAFMNKGYHVFATARSPSKIPESLHNAPNVTVLTLDVTSAESITSALESVRQRTKVLHVLINNAGLGLTSPGLDQSIEEAKKLFDLNFFSVLAMMQAFSTMLVEANGCVVNNSSVGGTIPFAFSSIYNATKAALIQASETWHLEMAPLGVRVITLITGGIATNFFANLQTLAFPEHSYYLSVKDIIEDKPEQNPYGVEPPVFAQEVLHLVVKGATGKHWVGGGVRVARTALWLLPQSFVDRVVLNLKPFSQRLEEEHKKRV